MPWVFSTLFLLHTVGPGLDILVVVLNEVPVYWGLSVWEEGKDGKMIPKLYTCSQR